MDWEDIPLTAEWLQEIYAGIDLSRTEELAPSTIDVRLAAVRRLAYEASDTVLLSPQLAAGIRRVRERRVSVSGLKTGCRWTSPRPCSVNPQQTICAGSVTERFSHFSSGVDCDALNWWDSE